MNADFVRGINRADGQRTAGAFIGSALRHCRRAGALNLRHGPTTGVAAALQEARAALDGAEWVCSYCSAEDRR